MTTVAICIPTFNQAAYLEEAVRSALTQTHPCEVWVSDDASTDETPVVMAQLLRQHPQIKSVRQQQNLGIKGNPTWVLKQPVAEYIVRLDSDDTLQSDFVEKLLKATAVHSKAGYAHAAVQEIGKDGKKRRLRELARATGVLHAEDSLRASVSGYRVAANICMFRAEALKQINFYRDLNFAEDWDLAVRLADAGWGNCYVSEVLASYRVWDTSDQVRSRRKLAELEGCRRVIDESLRPAFTRRGWNLAPIMKARRRLALRHAECLRSKQISETERDELKQALSRLGNSTALRWKFRWICTPLAPLIQIPAAVKARTKDLVKRALFGKTP